MNLFVLLFAVFVQIIWVSGDVSVIKELDDTRTTVTWENTDAKSEIIEAGKGYQIKVDVSEFNVDGENGDYVTVKSINENDEESDALMFTYTVNGQRRFLYNNNRLRVDYVGTSTSNTFSIQFTRVGEAAATTSEPDATSTIDPLPTASPEETATLAVYLYGKPAADFQASEIEQLQATIAAMGTEYCNVQNCPLNGSITSQNVKIITLIQCPILWEDYGSCVNLTFALPIVKLEQYEEGSLWDGYQLNESHLKMMWETYAEQYLNPIGLSLYQVPNVDKIFTNRLIIICIVILTLVILIMVLRYFAAKLNKKRRKLSDTISIMGQASSRNSQLSLTPHYLQELPPLFSNDFPMYTEQRNHSNFADFNTGFADDPDPNPSRQSLPKLNISGIDFDENEEAHA